MTPLADLWKLFRLLTPLESLAASEQAFLLGFLGEERKKREVKRIEHLLRMSGIKRVKLLSTFDWTFNPKIPRDKILEFLHSDWLGKPVNLVLIGPAGVGKTHIASALCHEAILKGIQTSFVSLFDLQARLARAKNIYALIDYYARVPVLCIDEIGYAVPSRDQADALFQIVSKRSECVTTLVTTNLVPSKWGSLFDTATALAILDRLSLNGKFITLEGKSYRSMK